VRSPIPTNANMADYEQTRRDYRPEVPDRHNVGVELRERVRKRGQQPA
jgi:hypothetical protein